MIKKTYKHSLQTRRVYKVKGMDCASCASLIEMDLEDMGIKATCSYARETLEVEMKSPQDEEKIKEVVEQSGYEII